jgi:hypothetical protein
MLSGKKVFGVSVAVLLVFNSFAAENFRPPSVPLIACDPYFSIWSPADKLTDVDTVHWTGKKNHLNSLVRIDNKTFRLMGTQPIDVPPLSQTGVKVFPTRTIYTFSGAGINLELTFTTPALSQDLMVYARPVTYLTWSAKSSDAANHQVQVYLDASPEICVDKPSQNVVWKKTDLKHVNALSVGSQEQNVLQKAGDDLRIDWGWLYLATPKNENSSLNIGLGNECRQNFSESGSLEKVSSAMTQNVAASSAPVLACALQLPEVTAEKTANAYLLLAYDDEFSIQYFGQKLRPYWRRDGATAEDLLDLSVNDYQRLSKACADFDAELLADAENVGGADYARICALAYRQCAAACKLVADPNGQPLLFPKENFSNGCIGTVDIIYPMSPQFLLAGPSLTKAMLQPVLDYGSSRRWKFPFAPHDLGTYPHADGQVYGGGERTEENQMPVEESGDMIILVAALAQMEGNADYAAHFWPVLRKWAEYLKSKGFDPENQLCTDDFAGHLAHNVNLSAKAIIALGAFGNLCESRGLHDEAESYHRVAKDLAARWVHEATENDHTRLAFDRPDTWSQKYNLVWDRLLGLGLFPASVRQSEIEFYKTKQNTFGLPLDSREKYTKLDWTIWSASLASNRADFEALVSPLAKFVSATPNRVPMTDWFVTTDARQKYFQARSVVGAVFLPMLYDPTIWKKYASKDAAHPSDWAALPEIVTLVPAADRQPAMWKFTMQMPGKNWFDAAYDDSQWSEGLSGFGSTVGGGINAKPHTTWSTGDIWLRREIELPKKMEGRPALWLYHDDDVEIYLNGTLVTQLSRWGSGYESHLPLSGTDVAFQPGKNILAVHCHQNAGGQYIDVGVVEIIMPHPSKISTASIAAPATMGAQ